MIGSASRVRAWVLVEQPGPWGSEALTESRLDATIGKELRRRGAEHGARVLLIRRPGWQRTAGATRAYLVRSSAARSWMEAFDLDDPAAVLEIDWSGLSSRAAPGLGRAVDEPLFLVCTNGQHDPCCAEFGRPLVRALAGAGIEAWEASHVGGDRFAGNLVCLPEGVYLGRVPPDEAVAIVTDYARGLLPLKRYRGRSHWPPLVQAAELYARHAAGGVRGLHAVRLVTLEVHDGERAVAVFDVEGRRMRVATQRRREEHAEQLSCDGSPARPWRYDLDSVTPL